jgi:hypothetical protein
MADYKVILQLDGEGKAIVGKVVDAAGADVSTWGSITLELGKNPGGTPTNPGTTMGLEIKLRETKGCDDSGNTKYCMMLRSVWYDSPKTSNPET